MEIVDDLSRVVGIEAGWPRCCDRWRSITIGVDRSVQEGSGRLDLMLRPSTRRSRCRISVSRAFVEDKGTQRSSLLSCLLRAEPRRQAWLSGFRGSQAIGLRIRGSQVEEIGREGLQTQ